MKKIYPEGSKTDWISQATNIANGKIETSLSDIPMLLEWLRDMNWPGADIIAKFLITYNQSLIEPMRNILVSGDMVWIYWILSSFGDKLSDDIWKSLIPELKEVAYTYDEDGAHIESLKIICRFKLDSNDKLKKVLTLMKESFPEDVEDYQQIEKILA